MCVKWFNHVPDDIHIMGFRYVPAAIRLRDIYILPCNCKINFMFMFQRFNNMRNFSST